MNRAVAIAALCITPSCLRGQAWTGDLPPLGRLVDVGGYRVHLWCTGPVRPGSPTVVLSIGGGGFFIDWSRVQQPLSDSARVCSYDRPGFGFSEPGPNPRTLRQEAFELRSALDKAGESSPFLLVGQSLGAFVVRRFAAEHPRDVHGVVLVEPANENGKLGYRGQWVLPRTLASDRAVPAPRSYAESPPVSLPAAERDACRARAEQSARIYRPFDQLGAQGQRYRLWAMQHPACVAGQDEYFAEEMADFHGAWSKAQHPLGDVPLVVITGTQPRARPPGLSESDIRSDSLRIDLSRLSSRGRSVADPLSGHHVQLDNPRLVIETIRALLRERR